jgi:hypothetical protein
MGPELTARDQVNGSNTASKKAYFCSFAADYPILPAFIMIMTLSYTLEPYSCQFEKLVHQGRYFEYIVRPSGPSHLIFERGKTSIR